MASRPLPTETATINRHPASPENILDLRMNGTTPFVSHIDGLDQCLESARAMTLILEAAFCTAHEARNLPEVDTIATLNPVIVAGALRGIGTLLALGQFHHDSRGRKNG